MVVEIDDLQADRREKDSGPKKGRAYEYGQARPAIRSSRLGQGIPQTIEDSPVLTLKQAAAYLRISKAHLSNVINGKVPGVPDLKNARVGRRILIKREWADTWLEMAGKTGFPANGNI
jgi:excisionase family DNA binding protein